MGKQLTEMLKGTLEGIVLAFLSGRSAYGYEITAWLRDQGFTDIAEGTIYAVFDDKEELISACVHRCLDSTTMAARIAGLPRQRALAEFPVRHRRPSRIMRVLAVDPAGFAQMDTAKRAGLSKGNALSGAENIVGEAKDHQ